MIIGDLLRLEWILIGIEAPAFIWIIAGYIIVATLYLISRLGFKVFQQYTCRKSLYKALKALQAEIKVDQRRGLPTSEYDRVRQIFEQPKFSSFSNAWKEYDARVMVIPDSNNKYYVFSSESAEETFTERALLEHLINKDFYLSVPVIITSIGLATTFIAILVALMDVKLVNNRVQGLELLIQGLSGKFISSIVALIFATIYILFERYIFYSLVKIRHSLTYVLDSIVPRLSTANLIADIQRRMAEQSVAFRDFNTHLASILTKSFSESLEPKLERIADSIDNLNTHLRTAEARKHESITGTVETLMKTLEVSLTGSMRDMSETFIKALSGNAKSQFEGMASSLSGAADLLKNMNSQFMDMQKALSDAISLADQSSKDQILNGRKQAEELNELLRRMMSHVRDSTNSSFDKMSTALNYIIHDLSTKVITLNEQIATNMKTNTEKTINAISDLIAQADKWTNKNQEQIEKMLSRYDEQMNRIEAINNALDISMRNYQNTVDKFGSILTKLNTIVSRVYTTVEIIDSSSKVMKQTQDELAKISLDVSKQFQTLKEMNEIQLRSWDDIQKSMLNYQETFKTVQEKTSALTNELAGHYEKYLQLTEQNFRVLVSTSDDHFSNAVQKLSSTINELEENLENLSEIFGKLSIGR